LTGVGVVAALAAEARALRPSMRHGAPESFQALPRLGEGSLLAVSGIGCAAAGAAARALVEARVGALMTFGLAGGLDPSLQAGNIVLPSQLISREGTRLATSGEWRVRVAAALRSLCAVSEGSLLTSAIAMETPADKAAAFRDTGAIAVDMESMDVAEVAAAHQLPFIAVRVIVDTAQDALPAAVAAASRDGQVRIGRLIAGLAVAPGQFVALIRLARRYRTAMSSLRAAGTCLA
jgi:adenosylhomocysteine nucleosidase